ncbi:MAG: hypothetical protein JSV81_00445 [Anaerolineales bacterium]|nr:MAG: hypothetical protein JSV81_00445 [Anaerolineales bacterium]
MKRLLNSLAQTRYLVYVLCTLILLLVSSVPLYAEQGVSPEEELLRKATQAYANQDWTAAAMYFTAYIQRNPDRMLRDRAFAQDIRRLWDQSVREAGRYVAIGKACSKSSAQPATAGVRGKQDNGSSSGQLPVPATMPSTPPTYPLVCRGGGNMYFSFYSNWPNVSSKPHIWIRFEKAAREIGPNWEYLGELAPGQCSWMDRSVYANEPDRITTLYPLMGTQDFSIGWSNGAVRGIDPSLPYIRALQNENCYQSFQVYNVDNQYFNATQPNWTWGDGCPEAN